MARVDWRRWYAGLHREHARCIAAELPIDERLERARRFIEARHTEAIDLQAIARAACLSRFHFQREFKRAYGETPHQYLTRSRIEHARRLLAESDDSVTSICFEVGFQSLGSFSSLFHRHVGHGPARYRAGVFQVAELVQRRPFEAVPACFLARFARSVGP